MDNWADLAQLGFAAVMALMLLATIRELIPKLLEIIRQNAEAMQKMASAIESNTEGLARVAQVISAIEVRLARLEEQHSRNGRTEVSRG